MLDENVLADQCSNNPLCVIAFLPHILDCQSSCRNNYINMLKKVAEKYKRKLWGWVGQKKTFDFVKSLPPPPPPPPHLPQNQILMATNNRIRINFLFIYFNFLVGPGLRAERKLVWKKLWTSGDLVTPQWLCLTAKSKNFLFWGDRFPRMESPSF